LEVFLFVARTGFEPDGTISFDTQDVLFEIVWQRPEDYNLSTGLADPYARTSANDGGKRQPLQSRVYQTVKVVNDFKNGAFEQTLHGSIYRFPIPGKSNTANPSAADTSSEGNDANRPVSTVARTAGSTRPVKDSTVVANSTSVTGSTPTSGVARGVQQILSPPTTSAAPTLTELQRSSVYIAARRSGVTAPAALQAARDSFAANAGGSPVTSNGNAVATEQPAPGRLRGIPSPTSVTNPGNQTIAKDS
jgi:hypothetical protein